MRTFMDFDFAGVWDGICYDDAGMFIPEPQIIVMRILTNLENDIDTIANAITHNALSDKGLRIATEYVKNVREKIIFLKDYFHQND